MGLYDNGVPRAVSEVENRMKMRMGIKPSQMSEDDKYARFLAQRLLSGFRLEPKAQQFFTRYQQAHPNFKPMM